MRSPPDLHQRSEPRGVSRPCPEWGAGPAKPCSGLWYQRSSRSPSTQQSSTVSPSSSAGKSSSKGAMPFRSSPSAENQPRISLSRASSALASGRPPSVEAVSWFSADCNSTRSARTSTASSALASRSGISRRACSSVKIRSTPDSLPKTPRRVHSAARAGGRQRHDDTCISAWVPSWSCRAAWLTAVLGSRSGAGAAPTR